VPLVTKREFLENFFAEPDVVFLKEIGMNALRVPFNYRHFLFEQSQLFPLNLNHRGFVSLDRVIDLCSAHGIYTILDLHAVPGKSNQTITKL
jgi:endoglucanase